MDDTIQIRTPSTERENGSNLSFYTQVTFEALVIKTLELAGTNFALEKNFRRCSNQSSSHSLQHLTLRAL